MPFTLLTCQRREILFSIVEVHALSCYQCSMRYTNGECNSYNSTYATECQPTFDTCVTIVLKPGRKIFVPLDHRSSFVTDQDELSFVILIDMHLCCFSSHSRSITHHQILHETQSLWTSTQLHALSHTVSTECWGSQLGLRDLLWRSRSLQSRSWNSSSTGSTDDHCQCVDLFLVMIDFSNWKTNTRLSKNDRWRSLSLWNNITSRVEPSVDSTRRTSRQCEGQRQVSSHRARTKSIGYCSKNEDRRRRRERGRRGFPDLIRDYMAKANHSFTDSNRETCSSTWMVRWSI